MKNVKRVKFIIIGLLVLLAAAAGVFVLFGNGIIKAAVEKQASKALGVEVTVRDIDLSLFSGGLQLEGLQVRNPEGYNHENLLKLENISVNTRISSLFKDTVNIQYIKLSGMDLVLEQKNITSNLQEVVSNIKKGRKSDKKESPELEKKKGKQLIIDKLEISEIQVKAKLLPIPGKADTITMKLDPITMQDLGTDNKLDIAVLSTRILLAVASGVAGQGTDVLPDEMLNNINKTLESTLKLGTSALEEGRKTIESGEELFRGLKDIFKKKE